VDDVVIKWGTFVTVAIEFLIIAWVVFIIVKSINKMKRQRPAEPVVPKGPTQEELLTEIRDLLKK
jgi:large conductance mechanosensitive channel